ncbi:hypothetical protein BRC71_06380 [Halobacteriales archaeon QH_7_65_31]|nr:MAG: hypothetical protein BRC71_06380 [Halobacteriales archaeon QH_7_65_31]
MSGTSWKDWREKQEKAEREIENIEQSIAEKELRINELKREIENDKKKRKMKERRIERLVRYEADVFLEEHEDAEFMRQSQSDSEGSSSEAAGENGV